MFLAKNSERRRSPGRKLAAHHGTFTATKGAAMTPATMPDSPTEYLDGLNRKQRRAWLAEAGRAKRQRLKREAIEKAQGPSLTIYRTKAGETAYEIKGT